MINNSKADAAARIARGANVAASDLDRWTPLHVAASKGHHELAGMLIRSGADVNATDAKGQTPLHRAAAGGHDTAAGLLVAGGANGVPDEVLSNLGEREPASRRRETSGSRRSVRSPERRRM